MNPIQQDPKNKNSYLSLKNWFTSNFKIGDYIKLSRWTKYKLKVIDIGDEFIIVKCPDKTLGHREINCDWKLAKNNIVR